MYRLPPSGLEVFLAHPGGPFFRRKDAGVWSIPKGEIEPGEDLLAAARREFKEEVGLDPSGPFLPLGNIIQKGGKIVHGWAFASDWPESQVHICNEFSLEWPPGSGNIQLFPEIDRVGFFNLRDAKEKLKPTQHPFLERLEHLLKEMNSKQNSQ